MKWNSIVGTYIVFLISPGIKYTIIYLLMKKIKNYFKPIQRNICLNMVVGVLLGLLLEKKYLVIPWLGK